MRWQYCTYMYTLETIRFIHVHILVRYLFKTLAMPKSPSFTTPDLVRKMFWESKPSYNATHAVLFKVALQHTSLYMYMYMYLSFDVSVENLPVMDVFHCQTDLDKPVQDLAWGGNCRTVQIHVCTLTHSHTPHSHKLTHSTLTHTCTHSTLTHTHTHITPTCTCTCTYMYIAYTLCSNLNGFENTYTCVHAKN